MRKKKIWKKKLKNMDDRMRMEPHKENRAWNKYAWKDNARNSRTDEKHNRYRWPITKQYKYSWPLNYMALNCTAHLYADFFQ